MDKNLTAGDRGRPRLSRSGRLARYAAAIAWGTLAGGGLALAQPAQPTTPVLPPALLPVQAAAPQPTVPAPLRVNQPPAATPGTAPIQPMTIPGSTSPTAGNPPTTTPNLPYPSGSAPAANSGPFANPVMNPLTNPLLSPPPGGVAGSPQPTPATQQKLDKYVQKVLDPETTFDIVSGQTRVLVLKGNAFRIQAGDERYLGVNIVNPKEVLIQGREIGTTVLNIWFGDANDPTKQETLSYLIRIFPDPEAKERLDRAYKALEDDINKYFKDSDVRLKVVGDKLVVSGRVRDAVQGTQILRIINASTQGHVGSVMTNTAGDASRAPLQTATFDNAGNLLASGLDSFRASGNSNIINLLEVAGEQQVLLRVIVAEVNRQAARSVGMNFSINNNQGITVFSNNTGPVIGLTSFGQGGGAAGLAGIGGYGMNGGVFANLSATLNGAQIPLAIEALKTMSYARSLAEPTLVTLNGQPANFLAGGQFPVPVVTGNTFGGLQGVQFVPYGVMLNFTPVITDRDRIRLALSATVSARDLAAGTNIGGSSVAGLSSRNVNTTVELRQGETLAVAGLIENNIGANTNRVPFIGDLPFVGQWTGLNQQSAGEKELVIFITPELTRPLDVGAKLPLPGAEILDPTDVEFYVLNRLEGHCRDFRSPIRTDLSRIKQYHLLESTYMSGQYGYSEPLVNVRP